MFFIIGEDDNPIYDQNLGIFKGKVNSFHLQHFIAYGALDVIEKKQFQTPNMYIGLADKHLQYQIFSFITAANFKFLLLLETQN
jgi:hypothetical protein